ncbi:MAG: hypothetical protein ACFFCP_05525 [Promethearchaeota archaeon]
MKFLDIPELKWLVLSLFATTFLLKLWLSMNDTVGLALIGGGLTMFTYSIVHDLKAHEKPRVIWDQERAIVAVIRTWRVEVCAARLLGSVPLGIDLSHSARRVLQAMHTRFENEEGGTLIFFITRPVGRGATKIGMLVRRSATRIPNTVAKVEQLSKLLVSDSMVMESAMRAAYPHLPVEQAEKEDILMAISGGVETSV